MLLKYASRFTPTTCTSLVLTFLIVFNPSLFVIDVIAQPRHSVPTETAQAETEPSLLVSGSVSELFAANRSMKTADTPPTFVPSIRPSDWSDSSLVWKVVMSQGTAAVTPAPTGQSSSASQKKSSKLKWILIAAAGGAAVGVLAFTKKSGDDSSSPTSIQPSIQPPTVVAGPPTIGPPQ